MSDSKADCAKGFGAFVEPILLNAERQADRALASQTYVLDEAPAPEISIMQLIALARRELDWQAARRKIFPEGIIHDNCWAILLDIFISEFDGTSIRVSDSAERWPIRPETALRQIAGLIAINLIRRTPSEDPEGPVCFGITTQGLTMLQRMLELSK